MPSVGQYNPEKSEKYVLKHSPEYTIPKSLLINGVIEIQEFFNPGVGQYSTENAYNTISRPYTKKQPCLPPKPNAR